MSFRAFHFIIIIFAFHNVSCPFSVFFLLFPLYFTLSSVSLHYLRFFLGFTSVSVTQAGLASIFLLSHASLPPQAAKCTSRTACTSGSTSKSPPFDAHTPAEPPSRHPSAPRTSRTCLPFTSTCGERRRWPVTPAKSTPGANSPCRNQRT